jgi:hypothetical protein
MRGGWPHRMAIRHCSRRNPFLLRYLAFIYRIRAFGLGRAGPATRIGGLALIVGITGLALAGCHPAASASPATSASATASATGTVTQGAAATPSPRLSVPGTHSSTVVYRISAPVSTVIVISHVGDVTVIGGGLTTSAASVTQEADYSSSPPVTSRTISGKTLTVTYTCPVQLVCGVAYIVRVPRDVAVEATAGAGAIRLTGLGGRVTAKADVGSISAVGLTGSIVSLATDVGGISATFAAAPATIQAMTRVGGIMLRVPGTVSYKVSVDAHLGKATVSVPQDSSSPHAITVTDDVGTVLIGPLV